MRHRVLAPVGGSHVDAVLFDLDDTLYARRARSFEQRPPSLRTIKPFPGVREALGMLRERVLVGVVTDGIPSVQWDKLRALGLEGFFDVVIASEVLGVARRKPHPLPYRSALAGIGVRPHAAVFIGDSHDDVAGSTALGMRAIRVLTGPPEIEADAPIPWKIAPDVPAAVELLWSHLGSGRRAGSFVLTPVGAPAVEAETA